MGNRLPVLIPLANWTTSDGMIYEGQPAERMHKEEETSQSPLVMQEWIQLLMF